MKSAPMAGQRPIRQSTGMAFGATNCSPLATAGSIDTTHETSGEIGYWLLLLPVDPTLLCGGLVVNLPANKAWAGTDGQ